MTEYYREKVLICNTQAAEYLQRAEKTQNTAKRRDLLDTAEMYSKAVAYAVRKLCLI